MVKVQTQIDVNRPVEEAWTKFNDESKLGDWLTGFKELETVSGEPLTVGSVHKMTFVERGKDLVMMETVTAVKENEEFSFELDHARMRSDVSVTFEPTADGLRITQTSDVAGKGVLWKVMVAVMRPFMNKRQKEQFDSLKRMIEAD